jgi:hypothetical protein
MRSLSSGGLAGALLGTDHVGLVLETVIKRCFLVIVSEEVRDVSSGLERAAPSRRGGAFAISRSRTRNCRFYFKYARSS